MRYLQILITLVMITLSSHSYSACGDPVVIPWCDEDDNGVVDIDDITAISLAKGTAANEGLDVRDVDEDGDITVLDARQCIAHCSLPGCAEPCSRDADEASRIATARALVTLNASNYLSLIDYWAEDIVYREPVWTNTGRAELLDYLSAVFAGTAYGFPDNRQVAIKNELYNTHPEDGSMTYMATVEWSGTFGTEFFTQTGMSIIKFRPGEGCPYYHRDYSTEGDTWWNIPAEKEDVNLFRNIYVERFGLSGRCFDGDGDGYTKYKNATGCPNGRVEGGVDLDVDCNDFVPEINPGAIEIPDNGIDEDCDPVTPSGSDDPALQIYQ
jgi:hypothetical protein